MAEIQTAAARVQQGDLVLYATALKVRQLVADKFYSVEKLDPAHENDRGYQRVLNLSRARKLADYIVKGQDNRDAFLPTSVFLATDQPIKFNDANNTIAFDTAVIGPFSVVDGQHRLEGLRIAAEKDPRVLDFEIPVNIATNLSKLAQMCHFLIVNTTQKSVDKSVEQQIISRLTEAIDLEDTPSLPKWIQRLVDRGEVERALRFVTFLNEAEDSPWRGKIKMANSDSDDGTVNQRSFVRHVVRYVLTANNPISIYSDFDREKKIFLNYWKAVTSKLDDGDSETLYKTIGVELFCQFSIPFFGKLQERKDFRVGTMEALLAECFENVEGEYAGVGHPDWWQTGGQAGRLNSGALKIVCRDMTRALHKSTGGGEIEI
jgi:DGQHR domain-containing protein